MFSNCALKMLSVLLLLFVCFVLFQQKRSSQKCQEGGYICLQAKVSSLVDVDHFRCKRVVRFSSIAVQHASLKIFL